MAEAATAVVGEEMWVISGIARTGKSTCRVSTYSLARDRWGVVEDTPDAVRNALALRTKNKIMRVGGLDSTGKPLRTVAEFNLKRRTWCSGLDCRMPVAAAAGVNLTDQVALVVGGTPSEPLVQWYDACSGWSLDFAPSFAEQDVFNGSAGIVAPRALVPGCRATIVSPSLELSPGYEDLSVEVSGQSATIVRVRNGMIEFIVPYDLRVGTDPVHAPLRVTLGQDSCEAKVLLRRVSPSLYILNYAATQTDSWVYNEHQYLHRASALAANHDGSLNCPSQPARIGGSLRLYATGLDPHTHTTALINGVNIDGAIIVQHAKTLCGVVTLDFPITPELSLSRGFLNGIRIVSGGVSSNEVTVSIGPNKSNGSPPIGIEVGLDSVFGNSLTAADDTTASQRAARRLG